jgi:putative transposase
MRCQACRSTAVRHRSERAAQGYRRFRCGNCSKQFNERSAGLLNRAQYPADVIPLVVLWRLRYKVSLRDLSCLIPTQVIFSKFSWVVGTDCTVVGFSHSRLPTALARRRRGSSGVDPEH